MQGLYNYFQCNFITCSAYRNTLNVKEEDDDDVIITDPPLQSPQSVSTAQTGIESTDALPTLSGSQFNNLALSASHCQSSSSSSTSFDVSYPSPLSSINPSQPSAESSGQGLSQLLLMFSSSLTEKQFICFQDVIMQHQLIVCLRALHLVRLYTCANGVLQVCPVERWK